MNDHLVPEAPVDVPSEGLSIGEAAQACGISVDTLRYYEKEGLMLGPCERDGAGRRRYAERDLAWLTGLVMLRETGMPIAGMREMAELYRTPGTDAERLALLERHRDRVVRDQLRVARHLEAIERKITGYRSALDDPARGQ